MCEAFVFPYSLVHTSFETIDILLMREALNGHSLIHRTWCTMVCPAVRSAFGFQGRNFVHEDRKALVPDVIMLIVVVDIIIIEHGWVETSSVLQYRTFSLFCRRQGTPLFVSVMTLAFGLSYKLPEGFV